MYNFVRLQILGDLLVGPTKFLLLRVEIELSHYVFS